MERSQVTSRVLMVRPSGFARNAETAGTNAFMHDVSAAGGGGEMDVRSRALAEFERVVAALRGAGVEIAVDDDPALASLPDAVFPNNWFTTHALAGGGRRAITYPMLAPSRRRERRERAFEVIREAWGIEYPDRVRLETLEEGGVRGGGGEILEGTGSLVLDRVRGVAYAVRSARTCAGALAAFAGATGYRVVAFDASVRCEDGTPQAIYHTNVMMTIGRTLAIWCPESVPGAPERAMVARELAASGREVVEISVMQMNAFAGNVLQLEVGERGGDVLAMSTRAYEAFTHAQRGGLMRHGRIVHVAIPTIEDIGGGGVRCMLAEVFG